MGGQLSWESATFTPWMSGVRSSHRPPVWGCSSVGQNACLSRRRPRVRVPSLPPPIFSFVFKNLLLEEDEEKYTILFKKLKLKKIKNGTSKKNSTLTQPNTMVAELGLAQPQLVLSNTLLPVLTSYQNDSKSYHFHTKFQL